MTTSLPPPNPYVGPRPFETGEMLYGRDWETQELFDLFLSRRLVLLHSPSGAGKTSLLQAALMPALLREGMRVLPAARVEGRTEPVLAPIRVNLTPPSRPSRARSKSAPNRYVLSTLLSLDGLLPVANRKPVEHLAKLRLKDYLDQWPELAGLPRAECSTACEVLVFDQFEEVLTTDAIDLEAKAEFFAQLGDALADPRRWALFAIRDDHVGGLDPYLRAVPTRLSARFHLDLLRREAAEQAILGPAAKERTGIDFHEVAAQRLVRDLSQVRVKRPDRKVRKALGPYVEPVQLQVVCRRFWDAWCKKYPGADRITLEHVKDKELADTDNALADYYKESILSVAGGSTAKERALRVLFGRHLITRRKLRNQINQETLDDLGFSDAETTALVQTYLVREERRKELTWYELSHDRLIEPILRNNFAWEKDLPIQGPASLWSRQGRPKNLLLTGDELRAKEDWAAGHADILSGLEKEFLEASRRARRVERKTDLDELGWGVIFAHDAVPGIRESLAELLSHRKAQVPDGSRGRYREFVGYEGYQRGETPRSFLDRHAAGSDEAGTANVPYYLLIVGDPETIPFEFQYGLDSQPYAVGRIWFEKDGQPDLDAFARYARSVRTAEGGTFSLPREAVVFGPQNPDVPILEISSRVLIEPLQRRLRTAVPEWKLTAVQKEQATKSRLGRILGGPETPLLLVAVCNGTSFSAGHDRQVQCQGALYCQDWAGGSRMGTPEPYDYFSADDVDDDARLLGMVAFLLAPYSAGTPELEDYIYRLPNVQRPRTIASRPFLARLPQRLLSHPGGGALAVVGHVERLYSFTVSDRAESDAVERFDPGTDAIIRTVARVMRGHTVGSAVDLLNTVCSNLSSEVINHLQKVVIDWRGLRGPALARIMTPTIDFRNYILLGDPAVRIPIEGGAIQAGRPKIAPIEAVAPLPKAAPSPTPPSATVEALGALVDSRDETDLDRIRACIDYPVGMALPSYAALVMAKKWPNGSTLRVRFVDGDPVVQQHVALIARQWSLHANITFDFGDDPEAEIRISFGHRGSWSAIGTDALSVPTDRPTMNFGWLRPDAPIEESMRVVLHEFGHALGLIHEHQNPSGGIQWNKPVVYRYYQGPPNFWVPQQVEINLFRNYDRAQTNFTMTDPHSVMMYPIPAGFTTDGLEVGFNRFLSETDKLFISHAYPKT